jgi:hypothetical protein
VGAAALAWAEKVGWEVALVTTRSDHILVRATVPLPAPVVGELDKALDEEGLDDVKVVVELVPGTFAVLESKEG